MIICWVFDLPSLSTQKDSYMLYISSLVCTWCDFLTHLYSFCLFLFYYPSWIPSNNCKKKTSDCVNDCRNMNIAPTPMKRTTNNRRWLFPRTIPHDITLIALCHNLQRCIFKKVLALSPPISPPVSFLPWKTVIAVNVCPCVWMVLVIVFHRPIVPIVLHPRTTSCLNILYPPSQE